MQFEVPKRGTADPTSCQTPVVDPRCFSGVVDLGAYDVQRGRDHGMPSYNEMRRIYGLAAPAGSSYRISLGEVVRRNTRKAVAADACKVAPSGYEEAPRPVGPGSFGGEAFSG